MTVLASAPIDVEEQLGSGRKITSAEFRAFFERSGMCMVSVDRHLRICEANDDFCQEFQYDHDYARGSSLLTFVHGSGRDKLRRRLSGVVDGSRARVSERMLGLRAGSEVVPGQLTAVAIDDDGVDRGMVIVVDVDNSARRRVSAPGKVLLSPLDAQILEGIAAGATTVALATMYYLSRQGVEYHVSSMLRKLRAPNRAALISRAYSLGLFEVGVWPPRVLSDMVE